MELSKKPLVNFLVFGSIIGMIGAGIYLWHASTQSAHVFAPDTLAYSKTHGVIFSLNDTLYRTDDEGTLIERKRFDELGLDPIIGDTLFIGDTLLVAEGRTHTIKRCTVPFSYCEALATVPNLHGTEALTLTSTPDHGHFYVATSGAQKIDYFTMEGQHLYRLQGVSLKYPNDILAYTEGKLLVADTNHHRIITLSHQDEHAAIERELKLGGPLADGDPVGRVWPTDLALDARGRLWVVAQDGFFDKAELLLAASPDTTMQKLQAVEAYTAKAKQINAQEANMLYVDAEAFEIKRIDLDGVMQYPFGDLTIRALFKTTADRKMHWDKSIFLAQLGIGLFVILLIAAALIEVFTVKDKKSLFTKSPKFDPDLKLREDERIAPDQRGIIWLSPKASLVKLVKILTVAMVLSLIILWGMLLGMVGMETNVLQLMGLVTLLVILPLGLMMHYFPRQRIGTNGSRIYLVDIFGRKRAAVASKIIFTGNRIIIDGVSMVIRTNDGRSVYDEAAVAAYLLPLLNEAQQLSEMKILLKNLMAFDAKTWLGVAAAAAGFALMIAFELN